MGNCQVCRGIGFVKYVNHGASPCPNCNPDSGYKPGEYEAERLAKLNQRITNS